jgi:UDP-N-acetylmuramoyl-tripeptide--D-alanyl-D-alanine ligase
LTWPDKPIKYTVKDPAELDKYCLYFAEEDDEESLLKKLRVCGASGAVVRGPCKFNVKKWKDAGIGIIEANNPVMLQIELARIYRKKFDIPFVQVIGSAGKTTTKDMIGSVLSAAMPTLVGYANYNTAFAAAYNILSLRDWHRAAVLEAGMKSVGYMGFSSSIIRPNIAVLISIQRAHFVTLGSIEKIIESKAEILDYLDKDAVLIINGEDQNCYKFPTDRHKGKIIRYGFSDKFDLWATDISYKNFKSYFTIRGKGLEIKCVINTVGKYNVLNALAAAAVGLELGLEHSVISRGLSDFRPMSRRLKIYRGPGDTVIIDDNFNANPDSIMLLLEEIPKFTENRPVLLVLGDVERPDDAIRHYAENVHFTIGKRISEINFYKLIAVGKWAKEYVKGAASEGVPLSKMEHFDTVEQAKSCFVSSIVPGCVIIFKASVYVTVRNLMKALQKVL